MRLVDVSLWPSFSYFFLTFLFLLYYMYIVGATCTLYARVLLWSQSYQLNVQ